ncbi:uncharacterized protein LOC125216128 isoform X2 [Salvia hispanica]|uniref:uncharacterized protein LOC125216128 isoform X2 n=1 Tax=Salvia hispanica TaxID=49212 RepID=UPI00200955DB|nr:uncharacterized protein LOC125216128 isoform X2 [Salvia hispanica]
MPKQSSSLPFLLLLLLHYLMMASIVNRDTYWRTEGVLASGHIYRNDVVEIITITCLHSWNREVHALRKRLVLPSSFEELKHVGMQIYGASFSRVLLDNGAEIDDIRVVRNGDLIVFAEETKVLNEEGNGISGIGMLRDSDKWAKESNDWITITITCLEKGDVAGKLLVLPCSFMELKQIGVKIYGAIFVRVLDEKRVEINDIHVLRNGDRVNFVSQKRVEESRAQKWAKESNTWKRVEKSNAQKWARESKTRKRVEKLNAHKRTKESNTRKRVEKSNAPVKVTCFAPIMRVLKGLW